jgi:UDP-glucuronate 4-epimerase
VRASARVRRPRCYSVLVTGAAGFVGCHAAAALRRRGDGVLGLDNFNDYYDTALKRGRVSLPCSLPSRREIGSLLAAVSCAKQW